jgi:hypothetical protein
MTKETFDTTEASMNDVTTEKVERRGRPVVNGSARQMKLARIEAKRAAGESVERGRPSNPTSARQQRLMAIEARRASGIEIKVGRPKGTTGIPRNGVSQVSVADILADVEI